MNDLRIKNAIYGLFLVAFMFIVYKCRQQPDSTPLSVAFNGLTMGSTYSVKYVAAPELALDYQPQVDSILEDFNKSLSTYRPDSEISAFNNGHAVKFQLPYFYPVLQRSKEIYELSGGAFDPTVGPLVNAWGFGTGKERKAPPQSRIDSLKQLVGFNEHIEFDQESVRKRSEGVYIDFNSIAPGYAADVIGTFLESKGIRDYMVDIGGEFIARGRNERGEFWAIGINNPEFEAKGGEVLEAIIPLKNRGLATSGNYRNFYEQDGKKYAHTIDPLTGQPVQHSLLSATILAKDGITADAMATVSMVVGMDKALEIIKSQPDMDAFFVYADETGEIKTYATEGIRADVQNIRASIK
jgi:FAD:protein FMN transferase